MGKGHRDNHKARKKRGKAAFAKKSARRKARTEINRNKCKICGRKCRKDKLVLGGCPVCRAAMNGVSKGGGTEAPFIL